MPPSTIRCTVKTHEHEMTDVLFIRKRVAEISYHDFTSYFAPPQHFFCVLRLKVLQDLVEAGKQKELSTGAWANLMSQLR